MMTLQRGTASATFEIGNDGIVRARWSGLILPGNAGAISALLLRATADANARGVIGSLAHAVLALPPLTSDHYGYVQPEFRAVPVAMAVAPEQAWIYKDVATEAALSGTMRRAFLSRDAAEQWLQQQMRALSANQLWWSTRRSLP
jgi:hypothetical protein